MRRSDPAMFLSDESDDEKATETKVVIVGKSSVGKTSIVSFIATGSAFRGPQPTVGANFTTKSYQHQNHTVLIQLWDTAGHERFRAMTPLYYRGARIALLVYAVDDADSFSDIDSWERSISETLREQIPLILIANKIDLAHAVRVDDGKEKAAALHATFVETSAVTGEGLPALLDAIGDIVVRTLPAPALDDFAPAPVRAADQGGRCC
jgi:small GTP-binding protein